MRKKLVSSTAPSLKSYSHSLDISDYYYNNSRGEQQKLLACFKQNLVICFKKHFLPLNFCFIPHGLQNGPYGPQNPILLIFELNLTFYALST